MPTDASGRLHNGHATPPHPEHQYLDLLREILDHGVEQEDRTGTGTLSVFGRQLRFDLSNGEFPLLTTKKLHLKSIVYELLWFLRGDTNVKYLNDHGVKIWNEWADENGDLGRVYGAQWRSWRTPDGRTVDQISNLIRQIKANPTSRRHLVVAYNPGELDQMSLPPCHCLFQFYVARGRLSCMLTQRSLDAFLGAPYNLAGYSLLTMMIAQVTGLKPGELIHSIGDAHLYQNHLEQARLQITREPYPFPRLILNPKVRSIFDYEYSDFELVDYQAHPHIKAEVSV